MTNTGWPLGGDDGGWDPEDWIAEVAGDASGSGGDVDFLELAAPDDGPIPDVLEPGSADVADIADIADGGSWGERGDVLADGAEDLVEGLLDHAVDADGHLVPDRDAQDDAAEPIDLRVSGTLAAATDLGDAAPAELFDDHEHIDISDGLDGWAGNAPDLGLASAAVVDHVVQQCAGIGLEHAVDLVDHLDVDAIGDGLEGRTAALILGELGVDAVVEHGTLDDLVAQLDDGHEVLVAGGPDRPVLVLEGIDLRAGEAHFAAVDGSARGVIDLADLEEAWERGSYEMVIVDRAPTPEEPIRFGSMTMVTARLEPGW